MRTLANLIVKKSVAWAIVIAVLLVAIGSPFMAARLENDDNLLAFLPSGSPEVKTFFKVNDHFGSLNVALVGIQSDDVLAPAFLAKLKTLTQTLAENTKGMDYVLSLTSVEDFAADSEKGGVSVGRLVSRIPDSKEAEAALREKVMSRDQVVGNLISADGKATLVYCFLAAGTDPKPAAAAIRAAVNSTFPSEVKYWGGAPFIQSYIYSVTEADIRRLTPWACVAIILIAIASFRDAIGSILALFSTGVGILVALAIMAATGVKANLVLGSMPVILFALGSAYPIHLLTRYYTLADDMGCEGALKHSLTYLGPTVLATGFVTISGLLSFMTMDMEPMRTFGLFTAIGVFVTLVLSVTFVPAVVRVINLKGKRSIERPTSQLLVKLSVAAHEHKLAFGGALGVVAVGGALLMTRLDTRIDNAAFYAPNSPPAQAETFLHDNFGGSQFFLIHVEGDMTDPAVLRELRRVGDTIAVIPHVTAVTHVGVFISKINEAMNGDDRIPDSQAGVKLLFGFLTGQKSVNQFVTEDRKHSLINIKVDVDRASEIEPLMDRIKAVMDAEVPQRYTVAEISGPQRALALARLRVMTSARIQAIGKMFAVPLDAEQANALAAPFNEQRVLADVAPIKSAILAFLKSDEFIGDLPTSPDDATDRIASALAGLLPQATKAEYATAIGKAIDKQADDVAVDDLAATVLKPVDEILKRQRMLIETQTRITEAKLPLPGGGKAPRFMAAISNALLDLSSPSVLLPAASGEGTLTAELTGQPVLNRGLSQSVARNQVESFVVAMGLVFVIALVLYRSVFSALLALSPMALTLLIVYGGMGALGVRLDIGTSMLASLSIGAGVDYAVHLLAAWKAPEKGTLWQAAAYSSLLVGRAIWTNAIMVAAGFVVLTMGEARPLQNVGGLTAAAMIAAALATFTVIPVLARRFRYDNRPRLEGIDKH